MSSIRTISIFILHLTTVTLVISFIVSKVDFCNSLLPDLLTCQPQIQPMLNSAAVSSMAGPHRSCHWSAAQQSTLVACSSEDRLQTLPNQIQGNGSNERPHPRLYFQLLYSCSNNRKRVGFGPHQGTNCMAHYLLHLHVACSNVWQMFPLHRWT